MRGGVCLKLYSHRHMCVIICHVMRIHAQSGTTVGSAAPRILSTTRHVNPLHPDYPLASSHGQIHLDRHVLDGVAITHDDVASHDVDMFAALRHDATQHATLSMDYIQKQMHYATCREDDH